ncbi:siderophore-interacting protein [Microbacterium sp. LRZ72]|uniref:siderophore-interacting protein n=1 Tax=Microbacterium sp. LRZ72 TaxID=2942481 RepID=UPI0029BAFAD9|nr:siderophore-interacting protein [Microbacterium sp. LRZ72]MDX2376981.1 siderophore-interacting protein [Microbacterium sp. LRZ72]
MITPTRSPQVAFVPMRAQVARIHEVSPTFRRFTLTGPEIATVADNRLDQRFKILFPTPTAGLDAMPLDDEWYAAWRELDNDARPPMRTYTVREVRSESAEFDVDIAVHGRLGPASSWALDARPGDEIVVCVPHTGFAGDFHGGIDFRPPAGVERILIAADETALPAVSGILERFPASATGIAVIEVPHADDAAALAVPPPGVEVRVVARGQDPTGTLLVPAVQQAAETVLAPSTGSTEAFEDIDIEAGILWDVPTDAAGNPLLERGPFYAWLAGEASPIKQLRRHLVRDRGVDRRSVAFMGYWRAGRPEM